MTNKGASTVNTIDSETEESTALPKIPTASWVTVTPEIASHFLTSNLDNRRMTTRHVRTLVSDIEDGNFLLTGETIKFDWNGRLIDGQHRCMAIMESGMAQVILVVKGLDPRVQMVIDAQKKRSASDALNFALSDVENAGTLAAIARFDLMIKEMKNPHALTTVAGARGHAITNSTIVSWVEKNQDAMEIVSEARYVNSKTPLVTSQVGWMILQMDRIDQEARRQFFAPLIDRSQPFDAHPEPKDDPRYAYWLALDRSNKNDLLRSLRAVVLGARAWNAWRSGEKIKLLRATTNEIPMALQEFK